MVQDMEVYQVQAAVTESINKRFDGDAYYGFVQKPKFIVDFFPNDPKVVTKEDIEEYLDGFTVTFGEDSYTAEVEGSPETKYRYQFVVRVVKESER